MEAIGFIFVLFGVGILVTIVHAMYISLGPRLFGKTCAWLAFSVVWMIILSNSQKITEQYAWILNIFPGILLIAHITATICKAVKEARLREYIMLYSDEQSNRFDDAHSYKIQKRLTKLNGAKKYLLGLKRVKAKQSDLAFESRVAAENATGFEGLIQEKDANWGTKAGIASGLFGVGAGIAVAADEIVKTEQYNRVAREYNRNLIKSGWQPGGVKTALINKANDLESREIWLSGIYNSVKSAKIVFNPEEEPLIKVTYKEINTSGYMHLLVLNNAITVKMGKYDASLDGAYKIKVLDSRNRVVGKAYYNAPGFGKTDLSAVGFSMKNNLSVMAAPKKGYRFSASEKYTFKIVPIKIWKIERTCRVSWQ